MYICNIFVSENLFCGSISFRLFWIFLKEFLQLQNPEAPGEIVIFSNMAGLFWITCHWCAFDLRTTCLYKLFVYYMHIISSNADLLLEAGMKGPKEGWICLVIFLLFLCPALPAFWHVSSVLCKTAFILQRMDQVWWIYLLCIISLCELITKMYWYQTSRVEITWVSLLWSAHGASARCSLHRWAFVFELNELVAEAEGETVSSSLMKIKSIFDKIKIILLTTAAKGQTKDECPAELCVLKCPSASGGEYAGSRCVTNGRFSWLFACRLTSGLNTEVRSRCVVGSPCGSASSHVEGYRCWCWPWLAQHWQQGPREEGRAALVPVGAGSSQLPGWHKGPTVRQQGARRPHRDRRRKRHMLSPSPPCWYLV